MGLKFKVTQDVTTVENEILLSSSTAWQKTTAKRQSMTLEIKNKQAKHKTSSTVEYAPSHPRYTPNE
jgi:hypothetical protein